MLKIRTKGTIVKLLVAIALISLVTQVEKSTENGQKSSPPENTEKNSESNLDWQEQQDSIDINLHTDSEEEIQSKLDQEEVREVQKRQTILNEYFGDSTNPDATLPFEKVKEMLFKFFIGNLTEMRANIKLIESLVKVEHEQQKRYEDYVYVDEYLKLHPELADYTKKQFEPILSAETMFEFSSQNGEKIVRRLVKLDLDRKGINDPRERRIYMNRYFGDELQPGDKEYEDEQNRLEQEAYKRAAAAAQAHDDSEKKAKGGAGDDDDGDKSEL